MTARLHLIIGGQRSGKSRHAERLAKAWLAQGQARRVTVVATALAADEEMRQRIAQHRLDRPVGFETVEAPVALGPVLASLAGPDHLVLIDCLTLWLTNVLMPHDAEADMAELIRVKLVPAKAELVRALASCKAAGTSVVLITNEIGAGVIPLGAEVRAFVDELGRLHQEVAQCCDQITWMVAGQPFTQAVERWT